MSYGAAALLITLTMQASGQTPAQSAGDAIRFEVASVKPSADLDQRTIYGVRPDGVSLVGLPLREIIGLAYDAGISLPRWKLVGGPDDLMSSRFTINAKAAGRATPDEIRAMLRALLADRFSLRLRVETRQGPVFALTRLRADRLGNGLRAIQAPDCKPYRMSIEILARLTSEGLRSRCPRTSKMEPSGAINKVESGTIAVLIDSLAETVVSRPIVDATGLEGMFEWHLRYQMVQPADPDARIEAPLVLDAVPEQLGLVLDPRTGPVEVFVIDQVTRPTPD